MADAPEPYYKLTLNGVDATKDLTPYVMSVTYTDNITGKADELQVELDNTDFRFLNDWYLSTGMVVNFWIGQMYCGQFMIDNPAQSGAPHIATFKAQSAEFSGPIRVKNSFNHYKKTLQSIVQQYANTYGLTIVGTIPSINLTTIIQSRQSDIDFLHTLARNYGCYCSIKGKNLVFDMLENLWKVNTARTINFGPQISYSFESSLPESADAAASASYDPQADNLNGFVIASTETVQGVVPKYLSKYTQLPSAAYGNAIPPGTQFTTYDSDYDTPGMITKINWKKAESPQEANRIALGDYMTAQNKKHTCTMSMPGDELLIAGNSVDILGYGKRSGYWLIKSSKHHLTKAGGYVTSFEGIHGAATTGDKAPLSPDTQGGSYNTNLPAANN